MSTLNYYATYASDFASDTVAVDFTTTQKRFLKYLAPGASILDFGCGSGRDSKYFLEQGYRVTAIDGCKELCALASAYTGLAVQQMLFQELTAVAQFDGLWACASILHVPKNQLPDIFQRICRALKPGGYAYLSFKYGSFEGERSGRHFTDLTESQLSEILLSVPGLQLVEQWVSADVRPGRENEKWLNIICCTDSHREHVK